MTFIQNSAGKHPVQIEQLLVRVDTSIFLDNLLLSVVSHYQLGKLLGYSPCSLGYEDLNLKLETTQGEFIIKIFNRWRSETQVANYMKGLHEFRKAGVPVPIVLNSSSGSIFSIAGLKGSSLHLCVLEYFAGNDFTVVEPSDTDIVHLSRFLARIHQLSLNLENDYDSWGTANLEEEYKSKRKYLLRDDLNLIAPVVEAFRELDFSSLRQSTTHGDFQRTNVLRNDSGELCILDLGTMNHGHGLVDLGIFLAHFCLAGASVREDKARVQIAIGEYNKQHSLGQVQLSFLPTIVAATYAVYVLAANYQIRVCNQVNKQSVMWREFGRKGLRWLSKLELDRAVNNTISQN